MSRPRRFGPGTRRANAADTKVHGLDGSREIYETPDGSFLNRIIETRRGIPIGLSVLYIAVAQKVGINLQGVSAPGHFLTRHENVDGPVFIDAFSYGAILTFEEAASRVRKMTMLGVEQVEETLEPVGPRAIILRMLNNLKALYAKTGNWQAAWVVQHRISSLSVLLSGKGGSGADFTPSQADGSSDRFAGVVSPDVSPRRQGTHRRCWQSAVRRGADSL